MEKLTDSLNSININNHKNQKVNQLKLQITVNDKITEYGSETREDIIKLYYIFFKQKDNVENYNSYPTKVEIIGDETRIYSFTTFKKLFY